jgi:hypothetical protein
MTETAFVMMQQRGGRWAFCNLRTAPNSDQKTAPLIDQSHTFIRRAFEARKRSLRRCKDQPQLWLLDKAKFLKAERAQIFAPTILKRFADDRLLRNICTKRASNADCRA